MRREQLIEKMCTSKRAFATRLYAEWFAANVLERPMHVYRCSNCYDWHLSSVRTEDERRFTNSRRDTKPACK